MRLLFISKASLLGLLSATCLITASVAMKPQPFTDCYVLDWKALYPTSQSMNNVLVGTATTCQLCHEKTTGDVGWNEYGQRIRLFILGGNTAPNAIKLSEPFNSDSDPTGSPNIAEITADTQPGWTPGPNNTIYFPFSNTPNQLPPAAILGSLDPGGGGCPNVVTYCTAKPGLACGVPSISSTGTPSASATSGFIVQASPARSKKTGILLYTSTGRANQPFPSGNHILCLATPPLRRGGPTDSGGTPGPQLRRRVHARRERLRARPVGAPGWSGIQQSGALPAFDLPTGQLPVVGTRLGCDGYLHERRLGVHCLPVTAPMQALTRTT